MDGERGMAGYRILMAIAVPFLLLGVLYRRLTGRAVPGEVAERLGFGQATSDQPLIWLHGASNGEIASARWLVAGLIAKRPELQVLVTCNNPTARQMVQGWAMPGVGTALAPYDLPGALRRFRRGWQPRALVLLENELWPERTLSTAAAGVPVLAIGARISERTASGWSRFAPGLMRRMLASLRWVSAQDAASEARLLALGLPPDRLGPRVMLKARTHVLPARPPFPAPPRHRCLLAASTHEGEEAAVLKAFASARAAGALDLLILAPRHPRRSEAVAGLIAARGLPYAVRSKAGVPTPETAVYLADTLGEMRLWYGMAGATFIGGTFANKGGHTPFEPAAAGSALLHGPSLHNFAEAFARLQAADAAIRVTDADDLATALIALTADQQTRMAEAAGKALAQDGGEEALLATLLQEAGLA